MDRADTGVPADVEAWTGPAVSTDDAAGAPDAANSLGKMLHILELFSESQPTWSTAAILEVLDTSRSTGYRYIKSLHDAGLIASVRNGQYSLGPRIIEMDLQIRQTDPLLLASRGVLEDLVDTIGHSALLCRPFGDSVLCVGEYRAPLSPANRFSRGERRPLFHGAVSKVILAHLPHHRLKALYPRQREEIERAGLGDSWSTFRTTLGAFKKDGYVVTVGEFNPGVCGVAAPVLTERRTALGSVGVAWDVNERRDVDVERAVFAVRRAATTISDGVTAIERDASTNESS
ncbi:MULTISPECIES: IclR family transcriptional regulator [unclassified Rhodococcus (in: high G+C Gram-positive bacteria)]|uniref:IclR family transcriptional regulator n=1 Tax=unclassified Rhodococcus (in: high G+C Gram-positive bacteria) TaxID=192944 RepID=UPI0007011D42|nr:MULTISPECIES: IclR family transcriptional regulator [unclassified Rhodococcus (in: high G+C Gram-positive bacteria)]KQU28468.1 hypothetical protein ASG69_10705 [Rhodococcus sp. Leaf225]KQU47651.1 hypothetical protein ASH03_21355 [Rhodococcus sp. Leaf258]